MAADIALRRLCLLKPGSVVLDPMAGSGTVLRTASDQGHRGIGFDLDPLAVLMARVWTTPINTRRLLTRAQTLVKQAARLGRDCSLQWVDGDPETSAFVDYWFARRQQADLRAISVLLHPMRGPVADALRLSLSRIIITKRPGAGASLGRDVSHSRPRRVPASSVYRVFEGFLRSAERLARCLERHSPRGGVAVGMGDARRMTGVEPAAVDAIINSPPYLNAIDYLRRHRLSLVLLGYRVGDLRAVRSKSIGAERAPDALPGQAALIDRLTAGLPSCERFPTRIRHTLGRYALDMEALMREARRVLRPGGTATFVVADSLLRGVFVESTRIINAAA
jgi:hypothetical protein